jgi:hypothetical protein
MAATLTCPIFRVPCYLLSVAVMARLLHRYRLFKKEMFILRSHHTLIACVYRHYYDTGNSTDLVRIIFIRPDVDKTGSVFFQNISATFVCLEDFYYDWIIGSCPGDSRARWFSL